MPTFVMGEKCSFHALDILVLSGVNLSYFQILFVLFYLIFMNKILFKGQHYCLFKESSYLQNILCWSVGSF